MAPEPARGLRPDDAGLRGAIIGADGSGARRWRSRPGQRQSRLERPARRWPWAGGATGRVGALAGIGVLAAGAEVAVGAAPGWSPWARPFQLPRQSTGPPPSSWRQPPIRLPPRQSQPWQCRTRRGRRAWHVVGRRSGGLHTGCGSPTASKSVPRASSGIGAKLARVGW